jgi:hypothetical protein
MDVSCGSSVLLDQPALCASFDGGSTRFFAVNPATRRLDSLATVRDQVFLRDSGDRDWLLGWWNHAPAAFQPRLREAIRVVPDEGDHPYQLAIGETVLASVSPRRGRSMIRVYPMPVPRAGER